MDDIYTLLVAESDEQTRAFLCDNLTADGYSVLDAQTAIQTLSLAGSRYPDLLVLGDLDHPARTLAVLHEIRDADGITSGLDPELPVLICSGRSGELDRLRGFEAGCDDYLPKPFSYPELRARIRALLRRADRARTGALRVGDVTVDPAAREVRVADKRVDLTAKEFALLRTLAAEPTRVFTKEELLRNIWGFRDHGSTRTLDAHAARLRRKLGVGGGRYVVNVWGVGYRLIDGHVQPRNEENAAGPAVAQAA